MWSMLTKLNKNLLLAIPTMMLAGFFFGIAVDSVFLKALIIPFTFLMVYGSTFRQIRKESFHGDKNNISRWEKVNAEMGGGIIIPTDQSAADGGDGTAPSPFGYFLASLGTCAGIYVLSFCQQRGIDTEGMSLTQQMEFADDGTGKKRLSRIMLDIMLPPGFPEKYRNAVIKAAELCTVKKVIMNPPEFVIKAHSANSCLE